MEFFVLGLLVVVAVLMVLIVIKARSECCASDKDSSIVTDIELHDSTHSGKYGQAINATKADV
jgi:hypothetical protein